MSKVHINLTSTITQEEQTEVVRQEADGEMRLDGEIKRISYESDSIPVKMMLREQDLFIHRGVDRANFSLMHFVLGEKGNCKYVVEGRQMDLISETKHLEFKEFDDHQQLQVEYDLFSGVNLIGSYSVTLIFA